MGDRHLALFVPSLRGGGAERVMVTLARAFAERGHAVDLVLVRAEGPYLSEVPEGVRVVDLQAGRTLASLPALVRYLRRERPDAMLSAMDHANVVALWARRLAGAPERLVVSVHSTPSRAGDAVSRKDRLIANSVRFVYPWADGVVAVSRGVADDVVREARLPSDRVRVIYNPIVTPELKAAAQEPMDHPWFGPNRPPVLLGAGRLKALKDFETLIRAFALVRQERPARLMILGEGEERKRLETLACDLKVSEDCDLPGFVENPYKFMANAAVFVLSSRSEGLPSVLIEALACGAPVVATDCVSGPAEILEEGRWGTLVPVADSVALAASVHPALATGRRPSGNRAPLARFCADTVTGDYLELLNGP